MNISSNVKVLTSLLFFSAVSIVLYRTGAFNIYLDLLSPEHGYFHESNTNHGDPSTLDYTNKTLLMKCTITNTAGFQYCGIAIKLNESPSAGKDLSIYKHIFIDADFKGSPEGEPIRLLFRNFNENYSTHDDFQSLKFNSMLLFSGDMKPEESIPIHSLQVADWWVAQRKIDYKDAHVDTSNISRIEVRISEIKNAGDYTITVRKFLLQGVLFSEGTLFKALLMLWLCVSIYLVKREHALLKKISNHDPLTKVMNRRGLNKKLTCHFSRNPQKEYITMFYIDIDDFKKVNDSYGHVVGDNLLREFCQIIESELRCSELKNFTKKSFLSRLSGDEFALILYNIDDTVIEKIANRLLTRFTNTICVDGIELKINASIGIAKSSEHTKTTTDLMENADAAMYHSKNSGKNQYKIFDRDVFEDLGFRKEISAALRVAIEKKQFSLEFMPIYSGDNFRVRGAEILIRSSVRELIKPGPGVFIPIAEEYGLIREIDLLVIETAFQYISQASSYFDKKNILFCINISAMELTNKVFPRQLRRLMDKYTINPKWIDLELTETSLINVDEYSIGLLHELKRSGVTLSLDDFGTGYMAFKQLLNYPVNRLKIDMSFVKDLSNNASSDPRMVDVILAIAHSYNLSVVAEGVETPYQREYLRSKKCDYLQGYLMSKPVSWHAFLNLIDRDTNINKHDEPYFISKNRVRV